jgi:hypothetical protein
VQFAFITYAAGMYGEGGRTCTENGHGHLAPKLRYSVDGPCVNIYSWA